MRPLDVERHGPLCSTPPTRRRSPRSGATRRCRTTHGRSASSRRPQFDPSLFVVAWDGDDIAGFSLNYAEAHGRLGLGRVLGVVPRGGGVGLGLALLRESFRRFRATGETVAALGVDSENPTGATRLYERAGMRVLWRADVWEKELRPGV